MTSTIYPKKFLALHFRCAYPTLLCVVTRHLGMWLIYVNVCFFKNSAKKMQILCLVLEIVLGLYEVTLSHASPMASTVNITTPTPFATSLARCHLFVPTTASLLWYHLPSCNQREGNLWCLVFRAPHVLPPAPTIILVRLQAAEPLPPPTACQGTCGTQDKLNPSK